MHYQTSKIHEQLKNWPDVSDINGTAKAVTNLTNSMRSYAFAVEQAMVLNENDFEMEDFKFGFKVPRNCSYKSECRWICDNMVSSFGIALNAIRSPQNYNIHDIKNLGDKFMTRLVDTSTDPLPPKEEPRKRQLEDLKEGDVAVEYSTSGYIADDDMYSQNLVVDDPTMNEDITVDGDDDSGTSTKSHKMWYIIGSVVLVLALVGCFMVIRNRNGDDDYNEKSGLVKSY